MNRPESREEPRSTGFCQICGCPYCFRDHSPEEETMPRQIRKQKQARKRTYEEEYEVEWPRPKPKPKAPTK